MAIIPANMDNCGLKRKCLWGDNEDIAYTPGEACPPNETFSEALCDCEGFFFCDCNCHNDCGYCELCVGGDCVPDPDCETGSWCIKSTVRACPDGVSSCQLNCTEFEEGGPVPTAVRIKDGTGGCNDPNCTTQKIVTVTMSDGSELDQVVRGGFGICTEFTQAPEIVYTNTGLISGPCDALEPYEYRSRVFYTVVVQEEACTGGDCNANFQEIGRITIARVLTTSSSEFDASNVWTFTGDTLTIGSAGNCAYSCNFSLPPYSVEYWSPGDTPARFQTSQHSGFGSFNSWKNTYYEFSHVDGYGDTPEQAEENANSQVPYPD